MKTVVYVHSRAGSVSEHSFKRMRKTVAFVESFEGSTPKDLYTQLAAGNRVQVELADGESAVIVAAPTKEEVQA